MNFDHIFQYDLLQNDLPLPRKPEMSEQSIRFLMTQVKAGKRVINVKAVPGSSARLYKMDSKYTQPFAYFSTGAQSKPAPGKVTKGQIRSIIKVTAGGQPMANTSITKSSTVGSASTSAGGLAPSAASPTPLSPSGPASKSPVPSPGLSTPKSPEKSPVLSADVSPSKSPVIAVPKSPVPSPNSPALKSPDISALKSSQPSSDGLKTKSVFSSVPKSPVSADDRPTSKSPVSLPPKSPVSSPGLPALNSPVAQTSAPLSDYPALFPRSLDEEQPSTSGISGVPMSMSSPFRPARDQPKMFDSPESASLSLSRMSPPPLSSMSYPQTPPGGFALQRSSRTRRGKAPMKGKAQIKKSSDPKKSAVDTTRVIAHFVRARWVTQLDYYLQSMSILCVVRVGKYINIIKLIYMFISIVHDLYQFNNLQHI